MSSIPITKYCQSRRHIIEITYSSSAMQRLPPTLSSHPAVSSSYEIRPKDKTHLARYLLLKDPGGTKRYGDEIFKDLQGDENEQEWTVNIPWHIWKDKYLEHQQEIDEIIQSIHLSPNVSLSSQVGEPSTILSEKEANISDEFESEQNIGKRKGAFIT
ncbi:hypothetical protein VKT23_012072 [Stygiomarasmius scandens]|uniref:Uncharacterized protein n=1 Tax=Marasmiellus scandens TaxID=2682957 RepID=A0ABR1JBU5_9AGAR